ncbi:uncharacterized protein YxjI [Corynebacterium lowii]|nr:uncharacterized protein YxjI [Corynebacterium lowii]
MSEFTDSLLRHDHLVMQQVTNWTSNDFDILDEQERPVGRVHTSGSLLSRMMMGNRTLQVMEADGTPLVQLSDTVNFVRDTMEMTWADGRPWCICASDLVSFAIKWICTWPMAARSNSMAAYGIMISALNWRA